MKPATSLEEFRRALLASGGYDSAANAQAAKRASRGALTTLRFSFGLSRVFPLCAMCEPFGRLTIDRWAHFCFSSVTTAEKLGMRVVVEGFKQREAFSGPVVYLANHMSTIETILLPPILLTYGPLSYIAKKSLSHLPFLGAAAEHTGMIPVGRKSPKEDLMTVLSVGLERIRAGESLLVFPQGSRQKVFSRKLYSSIGAKLAEKAHCPIVPIAVDTRCQPTREEGLLRKIFKDFGPVDTSKDIRCACGPVIGPDKSRLMHDAAFDWMASKLESWQLAVER